MSLSDEVLTDRGKLAAIRPLLSRLMKELEARSVFLIDEAGVPFAAVGNVEFRFPHPQPSLRGERTDDAVLKALLGMSQKGESSPFLTFKVSQRALLVTVLDESLHGRRYRGARSRVKRTAGEIKNLLEA